MWTCTSTSLWLHFWSDSNFWTRMTVGTSSGQNQNWLDPGLPCHRVKSGLSPSPKTQRQHFWWFTQKSSKFWSVSFSASFLLLYIKLRRLGVQNRIIDISDFKPYKFARQFNANLDYNAKLLTSIAILSCFQSLFNWFLTIFD